MHLQIPDQNAWHGAPRFAVTGAWAACHPAISDGTPTSSGIPLKYKSGCGCGLGWLGDGSGFTPDAAMRAAIAMYAGANLNPKDFQSAGWLSSAAAQIAAGQFNLSWALGNQCSGQSSSNMNLLTTTTGIALSVGGATTGILVATHVISAVTGAVLGAATLGAGALLSVITMIFAHHAAAVKRDLNFMCSALPAVNNAFQIIAQAVKAGQTAPADAASSLDTIYSQFMQAGGASGPSGIPDSGVAINKHPYCNAACEMSVILKGMVLYWQAIYQAMAAPAGSTSTAVSSTPATPGTVVPLNSTPGAALTSGSAAPAVAGSGLSFGWMAAGLLAAFFFWR